ncbi:hypothetical protein A2704_06790 [Candidatus Kaiserbacteria bacterium RIFCSPHIGHO2_01_FULL_54_36b]|uniref:Uncharacterized protein n=1 Tax=Candidatus Kaiserbacteria bacterium RIFCSPHIGHO2_01_FULL_54_36b TaxID=1798483 RepID=A0A1F6CRX2_9BACT|nr:MAG: hypothetical protein A2704_06790 [Candidatus Kaiserbacteria bacterium RIFCSPHIGHO2_01_FULL_54_36b]
MFIGSFASRNGSAKKKSRARTGRVGAKHSSSVSFFVFVVRIYPPKNPPSKNLRLSYFEPPLHAREARGVAENPWFSLAHTKENASEKNLVSCLVL